MTTDVAKHAAAQAAVRYVTAQMVLGVGTGSTVAHFIEGLGDSPIRPTAAVATSSDTELRLRLLRIPVIALEEAQLPLLLYVDGADEIDRDGRAIKGGGGAHRREKLVATASEVWVCIVDEHKIVDQLGRSALVPLEVSAALMSDVMDRVAELGGAGVVRHGVLSDSGNPLVDVRGLDLSDPARAEADLEAIPGVYACGIFAARRANVILVGREDGSTYTLEPTGTGV